MGKLLKNTIITLCQAYLALGAVEILLDLSRTMAVLSDFYWFEKYALFSSFLGILGSLALLLVCLVAVAAAVHIVWRMKISSWKNPLFYQLG